MKFNPVEDRRLTVGPASIEPAALDGGPARRILFLAHRVPYPPDKGDRIRSYHLLEHLARRGRVDLAFLADGPTGGATLAALGRLCHRVESAPLSRAGRWARAAASLARGRSLTEGLFDAPTLRATVDRWLRETRYDLVVCFSSAVLPYVLGRGPGGRLIADLVDVDSQKWLDYAARTSGPVAALFRLEGRRVRRLERDAGLEASAVVLATSDEAALYRRVCPEARVEAISNGTDLEFFRPGREAACGGLVFVGQLDYRANVLGLCWFCREAWPAIRSRLPGATLRIVGRSPGASVRRLGAVPGVEVVGPVADVRPYLDDARVVVVPLPVARGVQNKILEAMAMGRPVVASPAALEGLDVVRGRDALSADGPDEWSATLAGLWDDPGRRAEIGRNARRYVETNHRWRACLGRFDELIARAAPAACAEGGA